STLFQVLLNEIVFMPRFRFTLAFVLVSISVILFAWSMTPQVGAASKGTNRSAGETKTVGLPKVKPASFDGDVRNLPSVPINLTQRAIDVEEELEYPETPVGIPAKDKAKPPLAPVIEAPMPAPIRNFFGLSRLDSVTGGQAGAGFPPDTNGDIGPNHYIQSVNDAYAIYDKSTGALLAAFTENSLFSGGPTGTLCDTNSFGDPVVIYDELADRWILTNFAFIANATTWNPP